MKQLHLFPNGQVEVATSSRRRSAVTRPTGYRWSPGYSEATTTGVSQPLTRRHWQDIARRDGVKLVFHDSETVARLAVVTAGFRKLVGHLQQCLEDNLRHWYDEEDSVQEEHAALINYTRRVCEILNRRIAQETP